MHGTERRTGPHGPRRAASAVALAAGALAMLASPGAALSTQESPDELSTRVWLDRGDDPVLNRGERVRLYYRTNADAYVSIFQIDTNGTVRLLFPRSPDEDHYVRGGRDYRLLFPRSTWWSVDDDPGVGYFFVVASPEPFDFGDFGYSHFQGGWDLSFAGRAVYADPYAAMDDYIARLIPDWEYVPYALDFASYHVGQQYEYPRFLCYDCHGFRPYSTWNPYYYTCATYRVVVYNDPYYYPVSRYRGDRVVWVRPVSPGQPRFEFKERARGEQGTPLVVARRDVADRPGLGGSAVPRRSTSGIGSGGQASLSRSSPPGRVAQPGAFDVPRGATTRGRPSDALPGRAVPSSARPAPPSARPAPGGGVGGRAVPAPTAPGRTRPVLERRPPPRSGGGTTPPPAAVRTRPSGGSSGSGARPPVVRRPPRGGGGGSSPPATPTRGRGGGGSAAPATRPSSAGPPARPPARPPSRPPVRRPGGGASTSFD